MLEGMNPRTFGGGWRPDTPDPRDHGLRNLRLNRGLRRRVRRADFRKFCSAIENQGSIGSCTGNSGASGFEFLYKRSGKRVLAMSRLWLYAQARIREGTFPEDAGAEIRTIIKVLVELGCPPERDFPYRIRDCRKRPAKRLDKLAAAHHIVSYARLEGREQVLRCLAEGLPVIMGWMVFDSCFGEEAMRTGVIPLWQGAGDAPCGGHASLLVGFDDHKRTGRGTKGAALLRNSWGKGFGEAGYGWLPYEYLEDTNLADDFWVLRAGELE